MCLYPEKREALIKALPHCFLFFCSTRAGAGVSHFPGGRPDGQGGASSGVAAPGLEISEGKRGFDSMIALTIACDLLYYRYSKIKRTLFCSVTGFTLGPVSRPGGNRGPVTCRVSIWSCPEPAGARPRLPTLGPRLGSVSRVPLPPRPALRRPPPLRPCPCAPTFSLPPVPPDPQGGRPFSAL